MGSHFNLVFDIIIQIQWPTIITFKPSSPYDKVFLIFLPKYKANIFDILTMK